MQPDSHLLPRPLQLRCRQLTASALLCLLAACSNESDKTPEQAASLHTPTTPAQPQQLVTESSDSDTLPPQPVTESSDSDTPLETLILAEQDRLTLRLKDVPLTDVLHTISTQTGIDFIDLGGFKDTAVSENFSQLPLEQGLRQLLKDTESIFVYASNDTDSSGQKALKQVFLLPEGENATVENRVPVAAGSDQPYNLSRQDSLQMVRQHALDSGDKLTVQILDAIMQNQSLEGEETADTSIDNQQIMDEIAKMLQQHAKDNAPGVPPRQPQSTE